MEIFWFSFNAIIPLVLLVALGYLLTRLGIIDASFNSKANRFLFQVAFPISLFNSINQIELADFFSWKLMTFVVATIFTVILLLMLTIPRIVKENAKRGALIQGIYRGNFLLLGYPLAHNLFGDAGVGPTAMLLPLVIATYNVMAVFILEYYSGLEVKVDKKRILIGVITNPLIIGAVAGVIFSLLPWELPTALSRAVSDVGGIANPMALILLGSQFSWGNLNGRVRLLISAVSIRMVVVPTIVVTLAVWLGFRGPELGAIFILFCAPTAVSSYIMAKNMNSDSDLAAQIILATTLFSGISLFVFTYILRSLALI